MALAVSSGLEHWLSSYWPDLGSYPFLTIRWQGGQDFCDWPRNWPFREEGNSGVKTMSIYFTSQVFMTRAHLIFFSLPFTLPFTSVRWMCAPLCPGKSFAPFLHLPFSLLKVQFNCPSIQSVLPCSSVLLNKHFLSLG